MYSWNKARLSVIHSRHENKPHLDETRFDWFWMFWIFHVNRSQMWCSEIKEIKKTFQTSVFPVEFLWGGVIIMH